jgi:hypothetical protein
MAGPYDLHRRHDNRTRGAGSAGHSRIAGRETAAPLPAPPGRVELPSRRAGADARRRRETNRPPEDSSPESELTADEKALLEEMPTLANVAGAHLSGKPDSAVLAFREATRLSRRGFAPRRSGTGSR